MARKKKERSASPKLGAQYQAAKLGVQLAAAPVWAGAVDKTSAAVISRMKSHNYLKAAGVALVDQYGSKKLGHAGAISRNSVTAILPEVLAGADGAIAENLDPVGSVAHTDANMRGYDFRDDSFEIRRAVPYATAKYGLGLGRKVVNKTRIAEPVKKFLSMFGLSL